MYIPWGGTRTLAYDCPIVSWLPFLFLCIPSFFWLATIWICPLELRECQGGCCCCCCIASVVSDSVRPHRRRPTRLPRPWDSPGKNTGVGCHFLLQCVKMKSESEVAQSCLTLRNAMDCSLPGSFIHGIFQARVLEWGAITSQPQVNSRPFSWYATGTYNCTRFSCLKTFCDYNYRPSIDQGGHTVAREHLHRPTGLPYNLHLLLPCLEIIYIYIYKIRFFEI